MRACLPLLVIICCAAAGETPTPASLRVRLIDAVARPGVPLRVEVERPQAARDLAAPSDLTVTLESAGETIASATVERLTPVQLERGVVVHLVPGGQDGALRCRAVIDRGAGGRRESVSADVASTTAALVRLAGLRERLARSDATPFARLRAEQAAALGRDDLTLADALRLLDCVEEAATGKPAAGSGETSLALPCTVDGSVHPYRVRRCEDPRGEAPVALVMAQAGPGVRKHRWPGLPAPWTSAAQAAGFHLIEFYPAGDAAWQGIAARRVASGWHTALRAQGWEGRPVVAVGAGTGAAAALALAVADPLALRACLLADPHLELLPVAAGLDDRTRAWLRQRSGLDGHAPQLHLLPIAVCGGEDLAARRLRESHEAAGDLWPRPGDDLGQRSTWDFLRRCVDTPRPAAMLQRWRITAPGDHGPVRVLGLETWGQAGLLTIACPAEGAAQVQAEGLAGLEWTGLRRQRPSGLPTGTGEGKCHGRACGPLAGYADGPFAVVIGSGDHLAAGRANRDLAQAFLDDWVAHAQGAPPWAVDADADAAFIAGRHLICVGNPLGNRVLARVLREAPLTWDAFEIRCGDLRLRRGRGAGLALAWPRHDDPTRLVVVLDGVPAWERGAGLPLAGLADLVVRPPPGDGQALHRLFDSRWR